MDIFDQERERVRERINQIKENKRTGDRSQPITIAAGEPVLLNEADEYKALIRMSEILDFNMKQKSKWEYLELREQTKLESLDPKDKDKLVAKNFITNEEPTPEVVQNAPEKDNGSIELPDDKDEVGLANPAPATVSQMQNTQEYIESIVGNPALYNGAIPLGPSSLAVKEEIPVLEGEILPGELTTNKPEQNPFIKHGINMADVIDAEFEVIPDNPIGLGAAAAATNPSAPEQPAASNPSNASNPAAETPAEEELFEVVKTTPWEWIKDHKKQILIALGLSALGIALVVALTQLLPAYFAAQNAAQIAGLAGDMIKNSQLWHGVSAVERMGLHAANISNANIIHSLGGALGQFSASTGVWTFGTQTLTQFATSSATAAASAAAKVSMLTNVSLLTGLGGLATYGAGRLLPEKKSAEYKAIKNSIDNLITAASSLSPEDQTKSAQMISNKIIASDRLSDSERNILFKKLQKALKKIKKNNIKAQEPEVINSFGMDEPNIDDIPIGDFAMDEEPLLAHAM